MPAIPLNGIKFPQKRVFRRICNPAFREHLKKAIHNLDIKIVISNAYTHFIYI